jgi:hypothetical protein
MGIIGGIFAVGIGGKWLHANPLASTINEVTAAREVDSENLNWRPD